MDIQTLNTLMLGWVALTTAAVSPGPNMVAVVSRSLASGRFAGLSVTLGISIGAFLWACLSAFGLSKLLRQLPELMPVLYALGGSYLLYLGFKGLRSAFSHSGSIAPPVSSEESISDVLFGLTVTLSNPKVALLWLSLATVVADGLQSTFAVLVFAAVSSLLIFAVYGCYAFVFSFGAARRIYNKFSAAFNVVFGSVFSLLGGLLLGQLRA